MTTDHSDSDDDDNDNNDEQGLTRNGPGGSWGKQTHCKGNNYTSSPGRQDIPQSSLSCLYWWLEKRHKLERMTVFTRTIYRAYTMDLSGLQLNMSCVSFVVADSLATKLTRVFLISR